MTDTKPTRQGPFAELAEHFAYIDALIPLLRAFDAAPAGTPASHAAAVALADGVSDLLAPMGEGERIVPPSDPLPFPPSAPTVRQIADHLDAGGKVERRSMVGGRPVWFGNPEFADRAWRTFPDQDEVWTDYRLVPFPTGATA